MTRTWIFQANPDRFDIDAFLATTARRDKLARHPSRQSNGGRDDEVYLWQGSKGSNDAASSGIIAKAQIAESVRARPDDPPSAAKYWQTGTEPSEVRERALLRILRVANKKEIIQRDWLLEDPALRNLQILKMSNATNYAVDPQHARRIDARGEKPARIGLTQRLSPDCGRSRTHMSDRFLSYPDRPWRTLP